MIDVPQFDAKLKVLAVIPARYESTRFPGKPLVMLGGKPLIQWVWDGVRSMSGLDDVVVATDDERIATAVRGFGGRAMMTSSNHRSGTDRCCEVVSTLKAQDREYDVVLNVQGDEPFVNQEQLYKLINCFVQESVQIATLKTRIRSTEELFSPDNVKVVCNSRGEAIYFSRQPIPYMRGVEQSQWLERHEYYKHVGIYAFRAGIMDRLKVLPPSPLEKCESLEQLRWIEQGYTLRVVETEEANIGIDRPEDLAQAELRLKDIEKQKRNNP